MHNKKPAPKKAAREAAIKKQIAEQQAAKSEVEPVSTELDPKVEAMIQGTASAPAQDTPKKPQLSTLEKVKLMSALTSVVEDEQLVELLRSKPSGERIYEIFVNAVEREVSAIMNPDKKETPAEVVNLVNYTRQLQTAMNSFRDLIVGFMNTPLVQVLNMLNQNMGGKKFDLSSMNSMPNVQQHHQPAPQQPAPQYDESYDPGPGRGARGAPGLGSF